MNCNTLLATVLWFALSTLRLNIDVNKHSALCIGTGVEIPVLPVSCWRDNVYHFQHVCDSSRFQDSTDGLHDLRTANISVHPSASLHTHD